MWKPYLTDAHTGELIEPIDLPSFSWQMTINDSSLSTTKSKEVGVDEISGISLPWEAVPGETQREKYESIEPGRKAIALFWQDDIDLRDHKIGKPILWGVISNREDDWDSTTLNLASVYSLLQYRFCVRENVFKTGHSSNTVQFKGMTMRGIASEVGRICTDYKPGGQLPVDWTYLGEKHKNQQGENADLHTRTYQAWNINNLSGKAIMDKLAQVDDGVDMQWRPYLTADEQNVRLQFLAGTDEQQYLTQGIIHGLSCFRGGGTLENIKVSYAQPYQRWYGTGSGEDAATVTAFAQNLTLINRGNYLLMEGAFSDTDVDNSSLLQKHVNAKLNATSVPLMQLSGDFDMGDKNSPQVGSIWPGEVVQLSLQDYPCLPDGVYQMRIMEMSGDESSKVHLLFDVMPTPYI